MQRVRVRKQRGKKKRSAEGIRFIHAFKHLTFRHPLVIKALRPLGHVHKTSR